MYRDNQLTVYLKNLPRSRFHFKTLIIFCMCIVTGYIRFQIKFNILIRIDKSELETRHT